MNPSPPCMPWRAWRGLRASGNVQAVDATCSSLASCDSETRIRHCVAMLALKHVHLGAHVLVGPRNAGLAVNTSSSIRGT